MKIYDLRANNDDIVGIFVLWINRYFFYVPVGHSGSISLYADAYR